MVGLGFIGAGVVGTALAVRLKEKGYSIAGVSSRTLASARRLADRLSCPTYDKQELADRADLVFITTPDDLIGQVASEVSWRPGQWVVHCSGAASVDILEPARKLGAKVGTFHPLQTFADADQALKNLPGSTFALEAEGRLLAFLKEMAEALGGRWLVLRPEDKVLYHVAAVFACNYLVTLVKLATDLFQTFDVPPREATQALLPLLRGTLNNLELIGLPRCLTGPIARGDLGTIQRHLEALAQHAPELLSVYAELGQRTIPLALEKGRLDVEKAQRLAKLLKNFFKGNEVVVDLKEGHASHRGSNPEDEGAGGEDPHAHRL